MVQTTIRLDSVTKQFDKTLAVDKFSLEIPSKSIYGMLGPNGAGKTTTIRMMLNIIYPDSGEIMFFGDKLQEEDKKNIGYLPEERGLYPKMTVLETLQYFAQLKGMKKKEALESMDEWLHKLNIHEHREKKVNELSKGMQQKIQFIATVQHDPDLLILDEPFSGLDPINVKLVKDLILDLNKLGKTIIFSTHQMEQVEKLCDSICLINNGKKIVDGKRTEIKKKYGRNTVMLDFDGDASFLKSEKEIADINLYQHRAEIELKKTANPSKLLREWVKKLDITKFELLEPSMESIFIRLVGESNE